MMYVEGLRKHTKIKLNLKSKFIKVMDRKTNMTNPRYN